MLKENVLLSYLSNGLIIMSVITINNDSRFIYNNLPTIIKIKKGYKNKIVKLNFYDDYDYFKIENLWRG